MAAAAWAEPLRVATWHGDFSRKGPGLLLRDLNKGEVDLAPILEARPDILLLTDFDFDAGQAALGALQALLEAGGHGLPFATAARPNTGRPTDRDIDGDGLLGGPRDAQGYGWFSGQGGQAVLSRYPVAIRADLSDMLWQDAPESRIAPDDPGHGIQRLSSSAHWAVEVEAPEGAITLLTLAATPPVFDGPEDRNGRRNADEVSLWRHALDGKLAWQPESTVILLGMFNLDPEKGDGLREAVTEVLRHPRLQDPLPGQPTVTWRSTGPMRVSYVLPDRAFRVEDAGVSAPRPDAGPHGLVWVALSGS